MHRFPLAAIAALSLAAAAAPARAQSLAPSPALLSRYSALGAASTAARARREGKPEIACMAWRHLLWMEERDGSPESDKSSIRRLIQESCSLLY
jgi:hypothetical protein